jgi:TRAP-type C4-dicarboxylate transport system permease large subunit
MFLFLRWLNFTPSDYVRLRLYFPFQVYYSFFVLCFLSGFQSLSILHQQDSNTLHLSTIITTLLAFVAWKCHHMTWTLIPYQLLFLRSAIDSENVFFEIWWNLASLLTFSQLTRYNPSPLLLLTILFLKPKFILLSYTSIIFKG